MSSKVLFTRPEHDVETTYMSRWNDEVVKKAREKGMQTFDLKGSKATKSEFDKYLKNSPDLILFNGHGGSDRIMGHKNEVLVQANKDDALLKGKIVYALACAAGEQLGPSAEKQGAKAFIGYNQDFGWITDKNKECRPENDELANEFRDASNQVSVALIKGNTASDAFERSQSCFKEKMLKYSASNTLPEAEEMRFWLFWDKYSQVLLGDGQAHI